jgi:hypothetical protein
MNSVVFEKILVLAEQAEADADAGGSKRVHNKSRKNKFRKNTKKGRNSKHSRRNHRKRMQSNQNKMF